MLALTFFTAGILRQFHDNTPHSPYIPPVVGSLLFAGLFFLLLVAAREWRRGAVPGPGVRLGSVTPVLLMLLIEKWVSLALYNPIFYFVTHAGAKAEILDAQFRAFAGVGLLLVCLLVAPLSTPTARKVWRRARFARWPIAAASTVFVVLGTYLLLGTLAWVLGGRLSLKWPAFSPLLPWIIGGQAVLALAEEVYYRGLLLSEMERLAPRLGARRPPARRWVALISTSLLFGMEHLTMSTSWNVMGRQLVFTVSLGLLFGLLAMMTANLHYVSGIHAWINWLLLGAAPFFTDPAGRPALPAGTYIGVALMLAFIQAYLWRRLRRWRWRGQRTSRVVPG